MPQFGLNFGLKSRKSADVSGKAIILHAEDFESYDVADDMTSNGWTWSQYAAETGQFKVTSGKNGECKNAGVGSWAGGFELDAGSSWTKYRVEFDIKSYAGSRWIFGFRASGSGVYWLQSLPGTQVRLFKADRTFVGSQALLQDWDSQDPGTPHTSCKIEVNGSSLKVWINDVFVGEKIDSSYSTGSIIVSGYTTGWELDNIVVTQL